MPQQLKFYSWTLQYGIACAYAENIKQARQLVIEKGIDSYDVSTIEGKPDVSTTKPCAATWFN